MTWQPNVGRARHSLDESDSARRYPALKVLQDELERYKEQLGQWEVRAVAAEAEVTSLGFQKVAMEMDMAKYKEQVEKLRQELSLEKSKSQKDGNLVLERIAHIKGVLTKQVEELRKSESEARLSLENIQQAVGLFKNDMSSKEAFFSEIDAIFDCFNNKKPLPRNGKILKTAQRCEEKPVSSLSQSSQISTGTVVEEISSSLEEYGLTSPSPPPIPPKTPLTDEPRLLQHKKPPAPPPRKLIRSKHVYSPDTFGPDQQSDSSEVPNPRRPRRGSRLHKRRLSSRVDSLYSLAPPPGSPKHQQMSPGGFVFRENLTWSTDSEGSDYEIFTPPASRRISTDYTYEMKGFPLRKAYTEDIKPKETLSRSYSDFVHETSDLPLTKPTTEQLKKHLFKTYSDYMSIQEETLPNIVCVSPTKLEDNDMTIKKSSPILTKRPVWFKRESQTSTHTLPETRLPLGETSTKFKRRSRSLDANMQRSISSPVEQIRDQPVALSDSEDTTGGSESYPKPFHHIHMRKRFLSSHRTAGSASSIDKFFITSADWHRYDNDTDPEDDYINPNEVPYTPNAQTHHSSVDAPQISDGTYLMLTEPGLNGTKTPPQCRVGVSLSSPSPIPKHNFTTSIPNSKDTSRATSDVTSESGNDFDSEDYDTSCSNIYENPDREDRDSPIFDNAKYGMSLFSSMSTDEIYAQIDEIRHDYFGVPKPSDTDTAQSKSRIPVPIRDSDWQKEDGYARVGVRKSDQAPSLPPRPPNFTRVRPSNPMRTLPGIGSLPRYTTLGGSEHLVQLVPLGQTNSWRNDKSLETLPTPPSSTIDAPTQTTTPKIKSFSRKSLQHFAATPDLHGRKSSEDGPQLELPYYSSSPPVSTMSPLRKVSMAPKQSYSLPGSTKHRTSPPSAIAVPVVLEKSGYLTLLEGKQLRSRKKTGTNKWCVLKGTEFKYYTNKERESRKKTGGFISLDKCSKLCTVEGGRGFQLEVAGKVYQLMAAKKTECEEWLKVLTAAMQGVRSCSDSADEDPKQRVLSGWARVDGNSEQVWCFLEGHSLILTSEPGAEPIRHLDMEHCSVKCKKDSIMLDTSLSNLSRDNHMLLNITNNDTKEVTLLQPTKAGTIEEWYYTLSAIQYGDQGPELTRTEQFLSEIMKDNPISHKDHHKWSNPIFKVTASPMQDSLISLPTSKLKDYAKSLFKHVLQFMNKAVDSTRLETHIILAQKIIGQCLSHTHLQNEVYCQLLRQLSGRTDPTARPVLQGWLLLFALIPMYLPSRRLISWYLGIFLERSLSSKSPVICELAKNCQNRIKKCSEDGSRSRQCTPTVFELKALLKEFCSSPLAPPTGSMEISVSLTDGSVHNVTITATTTVSELTSKLTQTLGLPNSTDTGFALMCDWPGVSEDLCCPFVKSKVCDVISMWRVSVEELNQFSRSSILEQRSITFMYKRRLAFSAHAGSESSLECILLAHQISNDVLTGLYPVSSKEATQLSAIMAQIEYGDWSSLPMGEREGVAREAIERFSPRSLTFMALEHDWLNLQAELTENWLELAGKSKEECARLYLDEVQSWSMCGATVYKAELHTGQNTPHQHLFLAIHEDGVSLLRHKTMEVIKTYSYNEISTFGGHAEHDFMLVVTPSGGDENKTSVTTRGERLLLSMSKIQICEATFLMASYIECLKGDTEHL